MSKEKKQATSHPYTGNVVGRDSITTPVTEKFCAKLKNKIVKM